MCLLMAIKKKFCSMGSFLSATPRVPPLGLWKITSGLEEGQLNTYHPLS